MHQLEVRIENEKIKYSNGTGNLTIRGGECEETIEFVRRKGQTWGFEKFAWQEKPGSPHQTPNGDDVLTPDWVEDKITVTDQLVVDGTYKYTIEINDGGTIRTSDPEIQNKREAGSGANPPSKVEP